MKIKTKIVLFPFILLFLIISSPALAGTGPNKVSDALKINFLLPQGWKLPEPDDLKDDWRNESRDRFAVVTGDFNGDGVQDEAKLLVREDGSALGLFAFVLQGDSSLKSYLLDEMDYKGIQFMGIEKVSPGKYHTACGKGYWTCEQDEVPQINIKNDAINYFASESANSFFYWDNELNNFKRIWISD